MSSIRDAKHESKREKLFAIYAKEYYDYRKREITKRGNLESVSIH
jgi:hypothetical protein